MVTQMLSLAFDTHYVRAYSYDSFKLERRDRISMWIDGFCGFTIKDQEK